MPTLVHPELGRRPPVGMPGASLVNFGGSGAPLSLPRRAAFGAPPPPSRTGGQADGLPEELDVGAAVLCPAEALLNLGWEPTAAAPTPSAGGGPLIRGTISRRRGGRLVAKLESSAAAGWAGGGEWRGDAAQCQLTNSVEQLENSLGDLEKLWVTGEAALLDAIRYRWHTGRPCFKIRNMLVSVNPVGSGRSHPSSTAPSDEDASLASFCGAALRQQALTGRCAAFILTGESGAGKTEAARRLLLRCRGAAAPGAAGAAAEKAVALDPVVAMGTVLEAFGNAKTLANENASRFGLFRQVWPATQGGAASASCWCTPLLLERSRVKSKHSQERNFHIFYQMLQGLEQKQRMEMGMLRPEDYVYLRGIQRLEGGAMEGTRFREGTVPALQALGVTEEQMQALWACLGAVLACGNITWEEDASGSAVPGQSSEKAIARTAAGFGIRQRNLASALRDAVGPGAPAPAPSVSVASSTTAGLSVRASMVGGPGGGAAAVEALRRHTDDLACAVYAGVFSWLVRLANEAACEVMPSEPWAGILDPFGWDCLPINSLEQLLANHCAEKLHRLFVEAVLKEEHAALAEGSPALRALAPAPNDAPIELVEGGPPGPGRVPGLIELLSREGRASAEGSDDRFIKVVREGLKAAPKFTLLQDPMRFRIEHTFRPVEYTAGQFCRRNLTRLPEPLQELLATSTNPVVLQAMKPPPAEGSRVKSKAEAPNLVAPKLSDQLRELERELLNPTTDLHFVQCVRPNAGALAAKALSQKVGAFDWDYVRSCCKSLGVFSAAALQWKSGGKFTYRRRHAEFLDEFSALLVPNHKYWALARSDPLKVIGALLEEHGGPEAGSRVVSRSMVLLQPQCLKVLEERRSAAQRRLDEVARALQHALRAEVAAERMAAIREDRSRLLVPLQAMARRRQVLEIRVARRRKAVKQVVGSVRLLQAAAALRTKLAASVVIQRHARGVQARRLVEDLRKDKEALETLLGVLRGLRTRTAHAIGCSERSASTIQRIWRKSAAFRLVAKVRRELKARRMLVNVLETIRLRCELVRYISGEAAAKVQKRIRGAQDRQRLQELREQEAIRRAEVQAETLLSGALQALHWRQKLVEYQAEQAAAKIKNEWAKKQEWIKAQKDQLDSLALEEGHQESEAWKIVAGHIATVRERTRLARQHKIVEMREAEAQREALRVWQSSVLTLHWRFVHAMQMEAHKHNWASDIMEGTVRALQVRRGPRFRAVQEAVQRVKREFEDERRALRHMAALKIQSHWRRVRARYRALLPRLVRRLAAERKALQKACEREANALDGLNGGRIRGLHVWSLREPYHYKPVVNNQDIGWLKTVASTGEGFSDLGLGTGFALAAGMSGAAYLCDVNGGVARLSFRGPIRQDSFKFMAQPPKVVRISCGDGHALLVTDQGLAFGWGANNHGQCGIGLQSNGAGVLPLVREPTCVHGWASSGLYDAHEEPVDRSGRGGLPRVRLGACGERSSAAIDINGALWIWGEAKQVGLPRVRTTAPPADGTAPLPPFLLMSHVKEAPKPSDGLHQEAWGRLTRNEQKIDPNIKPLAGTSASLMNKTLKVFPEGLGSDCNSEVSMGGEQKGSAVTTRQLLAAVLDGLALEEVPGLVPAPAMCGTVICPLQGAERGRGPGTVALACTQRTRAAAFVPARIQGAPFMEVALGAGGANFAVSTNHRIYSWGTPPVLGMLGRTVPPSPDVGASEPLAPARLPVFARLSLSVQSVSAGATHVVALTHHGRVFTWGEMECCLGPEGFRRHIISEPVYVEGALRDLRVAHVAAGLMETAVAVYQTDTVLGWEVLEASPTGNKFLPGVYHYLRAVGGGAVNRLSMPRSEALQVLLAEEALVPTEPTKPKPLTGVFSPTSMAQSKRHFGSLPGAVVRPVGTQTQQGALGGAAAVSRALFQWAARDKDLHMPIGDVRTPALPLTAVNIHAVMRPRELVELDRDLGGFRRLAAARAKDAGLWGDDGPKEEP